MNVGAAKRRRDRADEDRGGPEPLQLQSEVRELGEGALKPVAIGLVELDHFRDEEVLTRPGSACPSSAEALEAKPFVRGVLVDDDEPVLRFGDDVGRRDLAASNAERVGLDGLDCGLGGRWEVDASAGSGNR